MSQKPIQFDGDGGALFVLFIKNLLLTIITFGIYYFWANVEQKKFVYHHTSFQGHRFEYTATGKEKFIAFLKVLAIALVAGFVLSLLIGFLVRALGPGVGVLFVLMFYLGIFAIIPIIQYRSYHFMLRRSRLNNIAFSLEGNEKEFTRLSWKMLFLTIITFGIASIWMIIAQHKYLTSKTKYAQLSFDFHGNAGDLFVKILIGYICTVLTLGIYMPWFIEDIREFYISNTELDGERFTYQKSGGAYFVELLVNFLLLIISLGLASPWVLVRNFKFIADRVGYEKEIHFEGLFSTSTKDESAFGEEAMALFD